MYSRRIVSVVLVGFILSFGALSGISMMDMEQSGIMNKSFIPSDTLDLDFSTYIGGSNWDTPSDVLIDSNGDIYVVGITESTNLPTTEGAYQRSHSGGNYWEYSDGFIMKLSGDGQEILYCSYLGGSEDDSVFSIDIDDQGCMYIVGRTYSSDFPHQDAYDPSYNGDGDCYVTKFAPNGSKIIFSTYIGGSGEDRPWDFKLDSEGNCIVVGSTNSVNFPVITTNQQPTCHSQAGSSDGFVFKLSSNGSSLEYTMYLGGRNGDGCYDVVIDEQDNVIIDGYTASTDFPVKQALDDTLDGVVDCFITKLNASGHIICSTFYGGDEGDYPAGSYLDESGLMYISGITHGGSFPIVDVSNPILNSTSGLFLSIINLEGKTITFSGVIRDSMKGDLDSSANTIIAMSEHEVWLAGSTEYWGFPTTEDAFDKSLGDQDGFLAMIDPVSCTLNYSSFFGGSNRDSLYGLDISEDGAIIGAGTTWSEDFPTMNALESEKIGSEHDMDGFLFRFNMTEQSTTIPTDGLFDILPVIVLGVSAGALVIVAAVVLLKMKQQS